MFKKMRGRESLIPSARIKPFTSRQTNRLSFFAAGLLSPMLYLTLAPGAPLLRRTLSRIHLAGGLAWFY